MPQFTKQVRVQYSMPMNDMMEYLKNPDVGMLTITALDNWISQGKTDGVQHGGGSISLRIWKDNDAALEWQNFVITYIPPNFLISIQIEDFSA